MRRVEYLLESGLVENTGPASDNLEKKRNITLHYILVIRRPRFVLFLVM